MEMCKVLKNGQSVFNPINFKQKGLTFLPYSVILCVRTNVIVKQMLEKKIFQDKKNEIFAEINDIQPKTKKLYKYDKYCKEITKRAEGIQNNLNNFDKDMQKEKDNFRY